MYPLSMSKAAPEIGFAVANDEAEHQALSDAGYLPPLDGHAADVVSPQEQATRAELLAQLEAKGVKVDRRWSDKRLVDELAKA